MQEVVGLESERLLHEHLLHDLPGLARPQVAAHMTLVVQATKGITSQIT